MPRAQGQDNTITDNGNPSLDRSQRRFLRRICNGRTVPVIVDGQPFLTYKEISRYLLSLTPDARDKACAEMRNSAARE